MKKTVTMSENAIKAKSAGAFRNAAIFLLIAAVLFYSSSSISPAAGFTLLSQIIQWLSLIAAPIFIFRALTAEKKCAVSSENKHIKMIFFIKRLLIAVIIYTVIFTVITYVMDEIITIAGLALIKSILSLIAVFFSYYLLITFYMFYCGFFGTENKKLAYAARISFIAGALYSVIKLYTSVCNITNIVPYGFLNGLTVKTICVIFYLFVIITLTAAKKYYLNKKPDKSTADGGNDGESKNIGTTE